MTTEPCNFCGGDHPESECPGIRRSFDSFALAGADAGDLAVQKLPVGARVGEYQVTGLLGQGGMGVVYSGVHPLLGRRVAIKVLNRQVAHAEAAARFLQEARAASRLRHQNIVDVFAFGQMPDGHYYQVCEHHARQAWTASVAHWNGQSDIRSSAPTPLRTPVRRPRAVAIG